MSQIVTKKEKLQLRAITNGNAIEFVCFFFLVLDNDTNLLKITQNIFYRSTRGNYYKKM